MNRATHLALACTWLVVGCDGDGSSIDAGVHDAPDTGDAVDATVDKCKIGDPSAPIELQFMNWDAASVIVPTQANQPVALLPAEQGGWAAVLGARARNLDGCDVKMTTAVVDTVNNQIIAIDQRDTLLAVDAEGWGVSAADTFSHLGLCPQVTSTRNLHGEPYILRIRLEDLNGKTASAQITVVPTCPAGPSLCTCECDKDYVLGQTCP